MQKEKALEKIFQFAQEQNLSRQEIDDYFLAKARKKISVAQNCSHSKDVKPGMFVYADNSISAKLISGCQVKAVVGYVENGEAYAVCLQQTSLPWSSDYLEVKVIRNMTNGKEATRKILEIAQKRGKKVEAAQWCYDYAKDGVQRGEAFLPSLAEWEKLYANKAAINASLRKLKADKLGCLYWAPSELNNKFVWKFDMNNGNSYWDFKKYDSYVRPILKIKL